MKRTLLFFCSLLLLCLTSAHATPAFKSGTRYRIVCHLYDDTGVLVLGANHSSSVLLYYSTTESTATDGWWYIEKSGNGFTIQNAQTKQYMTWTDQRVNGQYKYIYLTDASKGETSQWTFEEGNGNSSYMNVRNVGQTDWLFNLRRDGSNLFGAYEGNGSDTNELFKIYDEEGNEYRADGTVIKSGGGETGGETGDNITETADFTKTSGTTVVDEYWERKGITTPVVLTTDKTNPVLYSIVNLRLNDTKANYAYVRVSNGKLTQTQDASLRTHFYFVQSYGGIQIYSEDGQYVATNYPQTYDGQTAVDVATGSLQYGSNIWTISWQGSTSPAGYAIGKADNKSNNSWGWGSTTTQSSYYYWNDYQGTKIGLYNVDEGSTFVFTSSDSRHLESLLSQGIRVEGVAVPLTMALDSVRLNNKQLVYDQSEGVYYCPLPSSVREAASFTLPLTCRTKSGYEGTLKLDGMTPEAETNNVTVENVDCSKTYPLTLENASGNTIAKGKLRFTYLSIVEVDVPSCNGNSYTTGSMRVTYPDQEGYDSTYIAAFKYRGASSSNYPKRSYAVKMRNENGESVDRKFLGLRSDNNWILDAMYIDPACMRNRVATDLWNDYSVKPYQAAYEKKVRNGTRGRFVEVFLNGSYWGLYCMTEKLDRKQLKLKKYDAVKKVVHGLLYKSKDWCYETFMGHESGDKTYPGTDPESYTNTLGKEGWTSFEQKYPDYEKEAVEWEPLYNAVKYVAKSTTSYVNFQEKAVKNRFDYPVVRDYYLLIELILATDNHGKNMFYYVYDNESSSKISIAPWDMDGTWGVRWDGGTTYTKNAAQDFDTFIWNKEHGQLTLFYSLKKFLHFNDSLAVRYAELRQGEFDPDKLAQRITSYASLFSDSQADKREEGKWGVTNSRHANIAQAAAYAEDWIKQRVAFLDEQYGYDPSQTSINAAKAEAFFSAIGGRGAIAVHAGAAQRVNIYNVAGQLVRVADVGEGLTPIQGFTPGIYLVNGVKVVVR